MRLNRGFGKNLSTHKQREYIEVLFIDCGFDSARSRESFLSEFGVRYSDELTIAQASKVIEELKEMKGRGKGDELKTH